MTSDMEKSKLVYCSNCIKFADCEQAEYCGCCYDGEENMEESNGN